MTVEGHLEPGNNKKGVEMIALAGLILAWIAVFGGHLLEGGQTGSLTNIPAALIVLGGTLAAGMIQSDFATWRLAWRLFPGIFSQAHWQTEATEAKLVRWCQIARRQGLLSLEADSNREQDDFVRLGLQLLVDGESVTKIRHSLEVSMDSRESRTLRAAHLYDSLGGYAPTMGIIGAVLGLIQVMTQIEDTSALGAGIATAFVATIYGVGLANLFFLPVAARLRSMAEERFGFEEMVLDGIVAIADSENPRVLERRLKEYRP